MALSLATAMPAPPPLKPTFLESAASFFETDDNGVIHLRELDDNQLEELEEADRTLTESAEFRIGAASTHDRLDRHLLEYRQSMIIRFKFEQKDDQLNTQDPKTNANDSLFFPRDNNDQVYANVGWYLTWVSRRLRPRDRKDKAIKLPTLASRRWSMLHWMKVYLDHAPNYRTLQAKTNKALYFAAKNHLRTLADYSTSRYGVEPSRYNKSYFGRHELQYLIDQDTAATSNILVAESHHLAWILACICGLRPGAIGRSRFRPNSYLRWEHIAITREPSDKHKFLLKLTLPFMKGFQDMSRLEQGGDGSMELTINPPENPDNIPICPTHRFIIIALRRGLLKSYTTFQELLEDDRVNILIKDEKRGDFIFPAVKPRGLELDLSKPASSASFSTYLNKRAVENGFSSNVSMYSFRRKAGTEVDRVEGRATARRFLHHAPQSTTFEKSYDQGNFDLDVARIMYGEERGTAQLKERHHEVLFRAELHMTQAEQRQQIESAVSAWARTDAPNLELEIRRCRRYAKKALRQLATELHRESFTQEQLEQRMASLKGTSKLTDAMYQRAAHMLAKSQNSAKSSRDDNEDAFAEDQEDAAEDDGDELAEDLGDELGVRFGEEEEEDGDYEDEDETGEGAGKQAAEPVQPVITTGGPRDGDEASVIYDNCLEGLKYAEGGTAFAQLTPTIQNAWIEKLQYYKENDTWSGNDAYSKELHEALGTVVTTLKTKCQRLQHTLETDLPVDQEKTTTMSYDLVLLAFVDLMFDQQILPGNPRQCTECLADDTVTVNRYRYYKNESDLLRHVQSQEHSPWKRWLRKVRNAKDEDAEGLFRCYAVCGRTYKNVNKLQDHLEKVVANIQDGATDDVHHEKLDADGWLSPNFSKSRRSPDQQVQISKTRAKERIVRGALPRLTELSTSRPAIIGGQASTSVYVGPEEQDLSALKYPVDMDDPDAGLSFAEVMKQRGVPGNVVFGDGKLPKY
ncbi:hypothetical protein LTR37_005814 [Vermiconidia calcicola]|uniref:Uncharacterized protein n=1 Tax=Vermiconidia calcicola TaxID=1690605 RepID=A0ACC3NI66_9PEZI|nr:hypothetical protein LTR37_005814 [Vermiconidia calcicola]